MRCTSAARASGDATFWQEKDTRRLHIASATNYFDGNNTLHIIDSLQMATENAYERERQARIQKNRGERSGIDHFWAG